MIAANLQHPNAPKVQQLKIPPHSMEAEQCVIGSVFLDNRSWDIVSELITEECFYNRANALIFKRIGEMISKGKPVDIITLNDYLEELGDIDEAGGFTYLGELAQRTPSAANCRAYAEVIKERYMLRRIIGSAIEAQEVCYSTSGQSAVEILANVEQQLGNVAELSTSAKQDYSAQSAIDALIDDLQRRIDNPGLEGISTGFPALNRITNGLKNDNLIIVAARPAMGKSTFALNIAQNHALDGGNPYVFTIEMSREECMQKVISSMTNIPLASIQNPLGIVDKKNPEFETAPLGDPEWARISEAGQRIKESNLHINDDGYQTITKMRLALRQYQKKVGKPTLIVVDYLQLVSAPKSNTRFDEISDISRGLKALCKEFNCPLLAVSQLSRKVEERADKRPQNADLRESGQIEQDANVIMFVYRDEVYNENSNEKGLAEIIISKQRMGKTGVIRLGFEGHFSRFTAINFQKIEDYKPVKKHQRKVTTKGLDL